MVMLFVASTEANACQCRKDPEETNTPEKFNRVVAQTFRESSLVFSGKVIERNGKHLKFEVKEIWKGNEQTEILFTSTNYLEPRKTKDREFFIDSCAYNFKVDDSYLVTQRLETETTKYQSADERKFCPKPKKTLRS